MFYIYIFKQNLSRLNLINQILALIIYTQKNIFVYNKTEN